VIVRVKFCGMTREEDVRAAVEVGADFIGLVFAESPRRVTIESAARLAKVADDAGHGGGLVGVFVNEEARSLREAIDRCGLDVVQLHGDESPDEVRDLSKVIEVWKAIRVPAEWSVDDLADAASRYPEADAILLDTFRAGARGGTGQTFDHALARDLVRARRVVAAGGLTSVNVKAVVAELQPFAVDTSSGIESSPGVKARDRMEAFIDAARSAQN